MTDISQASATVSVYLPAAKLRKPFALMHTSDIPNDQETRVLDNAAYFDAILTLIPAKYYFGPEDDEKEAQWTSKYMKNKKNEAPEQARKESSKAAQRRLRFDADTTASATVPGQVAAREEARIAERAALLASFAESQAAGQEASSSRRKRSAVSLSDDSDGEDEFQTPRNTSNSGNKRGHEDVDEDNVASGADQSAGIEELRARLRARIEAMRIAKEGQGKRKARREEREKKKSKDGKKKQKKDNKSDSTKKDVGDKVDTSEPDTASSAKSTKAKKTSKQSQSAEASKKSSDDQVLDLAFGALSTQLPDSLAGASMTTDKPAHLRALTEGGKKKESMKQLLVKAKKYQRALQDLEQSGDHETRLQMQFDSALKRSEGQKVFDDPTLINKSMKRAKKKKQKSAEMWEKRKSELEAENTAKALKKKENRDNKKFRALKRADRPESKEPAKSKDASEAPVGEKAPPRPSNLARPGFEGRKSRPI